MFFLPHSSWRTYDGVPRLVSLKVSREEKWSDFEVFCGYEYFWVFGVEVVEVVEVVEDFKRLWVFLVKGGLRFLNFLVKMNGWIWG